MKSSLIFTTSKTTSEKTRKTVRRGDLRESLPSHFLYLVQIQRCVSTTHSTMKFHRSVLGFFTVSASLDVALAFSSFTPNRNNAKTLVYSSVAEVDTASATESLTNDIISKLQFREAQRELQRLELDTTGTLSAMRDRLREATVQRSNTEADSEVRVIDEEKLNKVRDTYCFIV